VVFANEDVIYVNGYNVTLDPLWAVELKKESENHISIYPQVNDVIF
jgi:hypothetical protein